jgi:hypothetical protein
VGVDGVHAYSGEMTSSRGHSSGSRPDNNPARSSDRREPLRPIDLVVIDVECNVLREELTDGGPVPAATTISSVGARGAVHRQRAEGDAPAFVPRVVGVHAERPVGRDEPEPPALTEVPLRGRNVMLGVTAGVLAFALGAMAVGFTQQRSQQEIPSVSQRAATEPSTSTRRSSVIATSTSATAATRAEPSVVPSAQQTASDAVNPQASQTRTDVTTPVELQAVQAVAPAITTAVNADVAVQAPPPGNPTSTGASVAPVMAATPSADASRTATVDASPAATAAPSPKAQTAATEAAAPNGTVAAVKPVVVARDSKPRAPVGTVAKSVPSFGSAQASNKQSTPGEASSSAERVKAALARLERRGPDPRAASR